MWKGSATRKSAPCSASRKGRRNHRCTRRECVYVRISRTVVRNSSRGVERTKMHCSDLSEALVDLVDGRLDGPERRDVERHLEGCANCRALVEDLRSLRAAAFMLDRREPKAETWTRVQAAIAAEP